jgi:hypothetical protein
MRKTILFLLFTLFSIHTIGGYKVSGTTNSKPPAHSLYGWAVTIHGEFAAISAPNESYDNLVMAGTVYMYRIKDGNWSFFQKITPSDPESMKSFGSSLKMYGLSLLVGAPNDNGKAGAAYVFQFNGVSWEQIQKIVPENLVSFQQFGATVELGPNYALISTISKDDQGIASGSIYQYRVTLENWVEEQVIVSPEKSVNDLFGACLSIVSKDRFVVGAPRTNGKNMNEGAIYSYTKKESGWAIDQKITPENGCTEGLFGNACSISEGRLLVGAMQEASESLTSGKAYLFKLNHTGKWSLEQILVPDNQRNNDYFGMSVSLNGELAIVGSPKWDNGIFNGDMGSVDIFGFQDGKWSFIQKIIAEDGAEDDHFGMAISSYKNNLIIGSRFDDDPQPNNGSAEIYNLSSLLPESQNNNLPETCTLWNYPNPFRQATTIYYNLPVTTHVDLSIFDLSGSKIANLVSRDETAGFKEVIWNGRDSGGNSLPSGIYLYQLSTSGFTASKKMILVK